jgi:hypothetical protein
VSWARLDDGWHDHPKVIAAGLEAAGLWAMCLTWAYKNRRNSPTPGVVPVAAVERFCQGSAKAKRLGARLVEVGLFDELTPAGWPIHDFAHYLPKYDPEQAKEAGARGGRKRAENARKSSEPLSEPLADRQAVSKRTSSTRASARRNPVPVPVVPEPDGSGSQATAQTLLAEWIDHCTEPPPSRVKGHVARELGVLLNDDQVPYEQVRAGLAEWHRRRLNPSALASVVHELAQGPRPSQAVARMDAHLDVVRRFAEMEGITTASQVQGGVS